MAIAYVGGQAAGRANPSAAVSVNFALSGGLAAVPAAGDLVVVCAVTGSAAGNPAMAITTPTGYTPLTQLNQSAQTNDTSLNVSYKVMGASPDTSVTIPGTANNNFGQAYSIQVFRGVDATSPMDVAAVAAGATGTGRPNPGSISPVTSGAWTVICAGGAAGTGANYTAPANYTTNFLTTSGADTTDAMVGSGYRTNPGSPEDPAVYTGGTTNAADSWASYTLALRPAVATGTMAPTEAADAVAFAGDVIVEGDVAATEAVDVFAAVGTVADSEITGTMAVTEAADAAAISGDVIVAGPLAASEASDTAAATGTVLVEGALAATEATDTLASTGAPSYVATMAATEAQDTLATTGTVLVSGELDASEAADALASAGIVPVVGTFAATEGTDGAAIAGGVLVEGALVATEATDAAAVAGEVPVTGALAATEAPDVAAFTSDTVSTGTLATAEGPDVAAFAGAVVVEGVAAAVEAADALAAAGAVIVAGILAGLEGGADVAAVAGQLLVSGAMDATEAPDVAAVTTEAPWGSVVPPNAHSRARLARSVTRAR